MLPPGQVRLWNSAEGGIYGNYIAPGEIPLRAIMYDQALAIGFSQNPVPIAYWAELYVEAVRPSVTTGDIAVTIELDPTGSAGFIYRDTVRFTAVQVSLQRKAVDESEDAWQPVYGFHVADPVPFHADGDALGGYHVYKVRVQDPRQSAPSTVRLGGQNLSLIGTAPNRQTAPFVVYAESAGSAANGPYPLVQIPVGEVTAEYNPKLKWRSRLAQRTAGYWGEFGDTMKRHVDDMIANPGWRNRQEYVKINDDATVYGTELHRKMRSLDTGAPGSLWMADVYVRMSTRKVEHVGLNPNPNLLGTADVQQIDMVRLANGTQRFTVGSDWNPAKVDLVIDIKASVTGQIEGAQKASSPWRNLAYPLESVTSGR